MSEKCWDIETAKSYYKWQFISLACIYIVGILGNVTIKLVLFWKGERSLINKLLMTLAMWDNLFLGCLLAEGLPTWLARGHWILIKDSGYLWTALGCKIYKDNIITNGWCQLFRGWYKSDIFGTHYLPTTSSYTLHTLAHIFQLASILQTVIISAFRCIAIVFPFQASKLCTGRRAVVATGVSVIVCICVHIPGLLFIPVLQGMWTCWIDHIEISYNYKSFQDCTSPLSDSHVYKYMHWPSFFQGYHVIFYNILIFFILPFFTLLILNIVMLWELWHCSSAQTNDAAEKENKAVTKVVVFVVTVFLVTYTVKPLYIVDIFYFKGTIINSFSNISCTAYLAVHILAYVIPTLNSVVNIVVYLLLRKSFRIQFFSMFKRRQNEINTYTTDLTLSSVVTK